MHARAEYEAMSFGSRRVPCPVEKPFLNSFIRSICVHVV
jgi:hypothetical protein